MSIICRTCLRQEEEMHRIFDPSKSPQIPEMILATTGLKFSPSDTLPNEICNSCFESLEITFYFTRKVLRCNDELQEQAQCSRLIAFHENEDLEEDEEFEETEELYEIADTITINDSDEDENDVPPHSSRENVDGDSFVYPTLIAEDNDTQYDPLLESDVESLHLQLSSDDDLIEGCSADDAKEDAFPCDETSIISVNDVPLSWLHVTSSGCIKLGESQQNPKVTDGNTSEVMEKHEYKIDNKSGEGSKMLKGLSDKRHIIKPQVKRRIIDKNKSTTTPRLYKCQVCEKAFPVPSKLQIHMRTHTGEKPYECQHCNWRCKHHTTLKRHMRKHTGETMPKPHKCHVCQKAFREPKKLQIHIRTHTGEKPHECQHCNERFTQLANLQHHMRKHTGETAPKRHICAACEKAFRSPGVLQMHIRTHTGEKAFECQHCNERFTQLAILNRHMHKHTGDKLRPNPTNVTYAKKHFGRPAF